jgi:hypothetical protein
MADLLCNEQDCSTLIEICKDKADGLATDLNIEVVGHLPTLREAFLRSSKTLDFYGFEENRKTSIYKEASHYGYWVNKLKPFRFEAPSQSLRSASRLFRMIEDAVIKRVSRLEELEAEKYDYPINEQIALLVALEVASSMQESFAQKFLDPPDRELFYRQRQQNIERIDFMMPDVLSSMRYFSASPLSFAIFIEAITRTRYV